MRLSTSLAAAVSALAASATVAQSAPAVDAKDVASPEAIVQSIYAVISGPMGQARNWDRMRGLMTANARFVAASVQKDGSVKTVDMSTEDYVTRATPVFAKEGFYEHGVPLRITRYGHVAVVESPYESRHAGGEAPFARGINQFVLINDGKRWWVTEIIWEGETPGNPLPKEAVAALKKR